MPDLINIDAQYNNLAARDYAIKFFRVGNTYYARKYDGTLISSGSVPETVLQTAITAYPFTSVFLSGGDGLNNNLVMSGSFSGITTNDCHIIFDRGVNFIVPNGFTGNAFTTTIGAVIITGYGYIYEAGTPARNWKCFNIDNSSSGVIFSTIDGPTISDCGTMLYLKTTSTGFINGNYFNNINCYNPIIGVEMNQGGSAEIAENSFNSINIQSLAGVTTNGFKNQDGNNNLYYNCKCWDIDTTGTEFNWTTTSNGNQIIGGRLTGLSGHFIDRGSKNLVFDNGRTIVANTFTRPDVVKNGTWFGQSQTAGEGILNGRLTAIAVGAGPPTAAVGNDSTGTYYTYDTSATINNLSGLRTAISPMRRFLNAYFKTALYLNNNTATRVYAGFISSTSAPASAADPLANLSGVGLWFDSAVSANWKRGHNDGDATGDYDDTGVAAATATLYPVEIYAHADTKFRFVFNGTSTDITTEIPASATNLAFWVYIENTAAASKTMRHYYLAIRTDK